MKKITALLIAVFFSCSICCSCSYADNRDFNTAFPSATSTDEEPKASAKDASSAVDSNFNFSETVIADNENYLIKATDVGYNSSGSFYTKLYLENRSNKYLLFMGDSPAICDGVETPYNLHVFIESGKSCVVECDLYNLESVDAKMLEYRDITLPIAIIPLESFDPNLSELPENYYMETAYIYPYGAADNPQETSNTQF